MGYTATIFVYDPRTRRAIGRRGLLRIITTEAPGLRYSAEVASRHRIPVLRVREGRADRFRETYGRVLNALDACGYRTASDLNRAAAGAMGTTLVESVNRFAGEAAAILRASR